MRTGQNVLASTVRLIPALMSSVLISSSIRYLLRINYSFISLLKNNNNTKFRTPHIKGGGWVKVPNLGGGLNEFIKTIII